MILAADVGGTKLLFGLFDVRDNRLRLKMESRYPSNRFGSLEEAVETFLKELPDEVAPGQVESACFAMAGPVVDGTCHLTNLGWNVSAAGLRLRFPNIGTIAVRNDMEAVGTGLGLLSPEDVLPLTTSPQDDFPKPVNRVGVLMPGTGLGEAFVLDGRVFSSEGGHCEFGPRNREEARLWAFLHGQFGHVSYERILSGQGFCNLVRFLMDDRGVTEFGFPMVPEEITKRANAGECELCAAAVERFACVLGAEAGNLALKTMALDGVYLGGGMVREILPWIRSDGFRSAFQDKGRFSDLMKKIPIYLVLDNKTALYGSALIAARAAGLVGEGPIVKEVSP